MLTSKLNQTSIDLDTFTNKVNNYDYQELDIYMNWFVSSDCHDPLDVSELIKNIKINFTSWVKSGLILKAIKDNFAYIILSNSKLAVKKWKDFCLTQFNKSSWYCNNIIKAAEVVLILWRNGFDILPSCESHAKPLTKFLPDRWQLDNREIEEQETIICDLWQRVLDASKDKHLTASLIKTVINPDRLEYHDKTVKINPNTFDKLLQQALNHNFLTVTEYLDAIANNSLSSPLDNNSLEPITQEKQAIWENDLQELIKENSQETLIEPVTELPVKQPESLPVVSLEPVTELPEISPEPLMEVQPIAEELPEPKPELILVPLPETKPVKKSVKNVLVNIADVKVGDRFMTNKKKDKNTYTVACIEDGIIYGQLKGSKGLRYGFMANQITLV